MKSPSGQTNIKSEHSNEHADRIPARPILQSHSFIRNKDIILHS